MEIREIALVIYTVLMQLAVGCLIVIELSRYFFRRKAGAHEADRLTNRALLGLVPVSIVAILASFGHLHIPLHAPYALTNFGVSWMSREIWLSLIFTFLLLVYALLQWRKIGSSAIRNILAVVTSLVGIALVYAMASVYRLEAHPAWNNASTPFSFFVTTFLLGCVAAGTTFSISYHYAKRADPECEEVQCSLLRSNVKSIALVSAVLLGIEFIATPLYVAFLADQDSPAAIMSAGILFSEFSTLFVVRLALVFIGAGLLGILLYRKAFEAGQELLMSKIMYSAFALVLTSELIGRYLFYVSSLKIGL